MTDFKITLVPLNNKNCPTWKVQCRMALVKDSVWDIVRLWLKMQQMKQKKFVARSDRTCGGPVPILLARRAGETKNSLEKVGGTVPAENMD